MPPPTAYEAKSLGPTSKFGTPTAWLSDTLAPLWAEEARASARELAVASARRKQVVFAVAAAECFLIEWIRDCVFSGDILACDDYLASRKQKPGIRERWKDIASELATSGRISGKPDFLHSNAWREFILLVDTRNALMHGNYSRPRRTAKLQQTPQPLAQHELAAKPAEWALEVVLAVITELCSAAGTPQPNWVRI